MPPHVPSLDFLTSNTPVHGQSRSCLDIPNILAIFEGQLVHSRQRRPTWSATPSQSFVLCTTILYAKANTPTNPRHSLGAWKLDHRNRNSAVLRLHSPVIIARRSNAYSIHFCSAGRRHRLDAAKTNLITSKVLKKQRCLWKGRIPRNYGYLLGTWAGFPHAFPDVLGRPFGHKYALATAGLFDLSDRKSFRCQRPRPKVSLPPRTARKQANRPLPDGGTPETVCHGSIVSIRMEPHGVIGRGVPPRCGACICGMLALWTASTSGWCPAWCRKLQYSCWPF